MKRAANITCVVMLILLVMVLDTAHVCHGFSIRPCSQHRFGLLTRSVKNPLWNPLSLKTKKNRWQTSLAAGRAGKLGSDGDEREGNTTTTDALQQTWANVKFGVSYVNDNYLDLLGFTLFRVLWVVNILWLVVGIAFALSPTTMGPWILQCILQLLQLVSQSMIVFALPIIIVLGVMLGGLLSIFTMLENMAIPKAITKMSGVASFLQFCKNLAQKATKRIMVESDPTKMTVPILKGPGDFSFVLELCLLAPIWEELQYRLMYDRINRWLARVSTVKSSHNSKHETFRLSTEFGSFLFACAHLGNWLSPSLNVAALVHSNVKSAMFVASAALVQGTAAFLISKKILFPVYQKRGVAASIGAHATWNALFVTNTLHVPFRLLNRLKKRLRRRRSE